jgi:hypothetical protein
MKCLETRTRADGIKSRRYQLEDGRRITMLEVPATVLKAIGMSRVQEAMAIWQRGEQQRSQSHERRLRIEQMLDEGIKPTAIAFEVGVTDQRVRQIRKEMQDGKRISAAPVQREPRRVRQKVGRDFQTRWSGGRNPFDPGT